MLGMPNQQIFYWHKNCYTQIKKIILKLGKMYNIFSAFLLPAAAWYRCLHDSISFPHMPHVLTSNCSTFTPLPPLSLSRERDLRLLFALGCLSDCTLRFRFMFAHFINTIKMFNQNN